MQRLIARTVLLALALVEGPTPIAAEKDQQGTPRSSKYVWSIIKRSLVAADGEVYFKGNLKDNMIPGGVDGLSLFTGTLLSAEPATRPSVLVLAIEDSTTPEVTLQMKDAEWKDTQLNGPLMRGSLVQFEGVGLSFTKAPFMLTLGVSMTRRSQNLKVAGKDLK
jgi:hypothetical protein